MFSVLPPHESLAVFGGITEGCDRMADEKQGATDFKWDKSEGWQTEKGATDWIDSKGERVSWLEVSEIRIVC